MKISYTHLLVITVVFVLLATACNPVLALPTAQPTPVQLVEIQPVDAMRTLTVGGLQRSYFLHVPPGLTNRQAVALVFVFHGFSGTAEYIRISTGFDNVSDADGFIVVYPSGTGARDALSWNAGACCGYASQNNIDDIGFVRAIVADVGALASLDQKRIYAAGFSNGAFLSYRLACDMSDTFAAVAPVAGVLLVSPCRPQQPVSLMHVHGLQDTVVPFDDSRPDPATGQPVSAVRESVAILARLDGCTGAGSPEKKRSPNAYFLWALRARDCRRAGYNRRAWARLALALCAPGLPDDLGFLCRPSQAVMPVRLLKRTHPKSQPGDFGCVGYRAAAIFRLLP